MVQLKVGKNGELELTDKKSTVTVKGSTIRLIDEVIDSPGEYEASGIEVINGQNAAAILWERLQITYVYQLVAPTSFEANQFSSSDIVLFSSDVEELTKNNTATVLETYDPKILVVPATVKSEAGLKESLKLQDTTAVKLTAQTLPEEGRDGYLLG